MTEIVKAVQQCFACPSSWDVWTADGRYLYFKYRYGVAKVFREVGESLVLESAVTVTEDALDGVTTLEEFCAATGFTLALREQYVPMPDPNGDYFESADVPPWAPESVETVPVRAQVLREAENLVCGDREDQYGAPVDNLLRIANYWNDYLFDVMKRGDLLGPRDVALMMALVKIAREANGHKRDSLVDLAGYAALAAEVA